MISVVGQAKRTSVRHQRHRNSVEEKSGQGDEPRDGGTKAAAAGEKAGEECCDSKEERDEVEDPAKSPHVEIILRCRVAGKVAVTIQVSSVNRKRGN